jgi:hypothetical protein
VSTGWLNPMRFALRVAGGRDRVAATGFSAGRKHERAIHRLGRLYRGFMIPDKEIGWCWPAYRAGKRIVDEWRPDIIYASAPPFTSLVSASALAFRTGIPWVAGLRDLWCDGPYRAVRFARLDRALESRVLGSANGIVITTREDLMRARFGVPTATVMNGYDPEDVRERKAPFRSGRLGIVHTGALIHDRRDPTPLFDAMRELHAEGRKVGADFYGRDSVLVTKTAERAGVADLVRAHGPVSYPDSIQAQRDADVLLLIQPDNEDERRIYPAKLFEYAAARRPVLAIGPDDGVVARLITDLDLGSVVQRADDIAAELRRWHDRKASSGGLPDIAERPPEELSRRTQVQKLSDFLERVVRASGSDDGSRRGANGVSFEGAAWRP